MAQDQRQRQFAHMSEVNTDFAPLIPGVNAAFENIWRYSDMTEFRGNWTKTRGSYPEFVPSDGFEITQRTIPARDGTELEIRIWKPTTQAEEKLPLLFVLHGGGFVVGSHDSENGMSRSVCVRNHMVVISINYRRAPEHRFPTALEDGYDGYKWVLLHSQQFGFDSTKIILGGTSAGSNLLTIFYIASLALKLRDEGALQGIIGQILNLPVTCHPKFLPHERHELDSYVQNADSPTINGKHMLWFWDQYYPDAEPDPLASPLLARSHSGLPPTLIQVAGLDPLRDEGLAYASVLRDDGVETKLNIFPGLPHGFMLAVHMEFSSRYFRNMVEWVEERLKSSNR